MKRILLLLLLLGWGSLRAQDHQASYNRTTRLLRNVLSENHYSPIALDQQASASIFDAFFYTLDPSNIYFTAADIAELVKHRNGLAQQIEAGESTLLVRSIAVYGAALQRTKGWIDEMANAPVQLNASDTIAFAYNKPNPRLVGSNEQMLKHRVGRYIRYKMLQKLYASADSLPLVNDALWQKHEPAYRKAVCQQISQTIAHRLDGLANASNFVSNSYFNAIANQYDPHSMYFSFEKKKLFEQMLSDTEYSFGFEFDENKNGDHEITHLSPGGPAWRTNELHKGDILHSMRLSDGTVYDLTVITSYRLEELLDSIPTGHFMELTVKQHSGKLVEVKLQKEQLENEDNVINSFVLEGDRRVGYIALPSFYTSTESEEGGHGGCASDIAKQVIALKREGIDALIIDLRNNGGGSVQEAVNMAGLFIDAGPVTVEQERRGAIRVLKDMNRGSIYSGPMIVLTNRLSASASEFFVAAMQDYNRAVVVGGTTYGKATGQIILPLMQDLTDEAVRAWVEKRSVGDVGFVKVTIGKFYRVFGSSHQLNGVVPDIPIPQILDAFQVGEYYYPTALPNDSLQKETPIKQLGTLPIAQLWEKSSVRQGLHPVFRQVLEGNVSSYDIVMQASIQLSVQGFGEYWQKILSLQQLWDMELSGDGTAYRVTPSAADLEIINAVPATKEGYDIRANKLAKDAYLEEAYRVMVDLINFQEKE